MTMKMKSLLSLALVAATALASCSKEETPANDGNGEDRAVRIVINRSSNNTRAVGDPVAGGTAVEFTSGSLLFVAGSGNIDMVVPVLSGSTDYNGTNVGIDALEGAGSWITDVPATSTRVWFVANTITPVANSNVSQFVATVEAQDDATGTVDNVMLYGAGNLTKALADAAIDDETGGPAGAALTDEDYVARFNVAPVAARFEIGGIEGTHSDVVADDSSESTLTYKVDGIFIDKYYSVMSLSGAAVATNLKTNGSTVAYYTPDAVGSSYTTALSEVVYDYDATDGIVDDLTAGKVWAYNLLAPTSSATTIAMPSIVVKVSNVKVNGTDWPGAHFLTIENFYDKDSSNAPITSLAQGKVYKISSIDFTEKDLTPEPYVKSKNALVEITILDWEAVNVGYDFN